MGMNAKPGLVAIYRWRIADEHVEAFRARWTHATRALKPHGGMGSLFARADDGTYYAVALWPDRETRERAFDATEDGAPWPPAERLEPILLDPIENLWPE